MDNYERAQNMLEDGESYRATSRATGISTHKLSRKFPGYGKKPAVIRDPAPETLEEAYRLLQGDRSYKSVARELDINPESLRRRFPGMGYTDGRRKPLPTEEQLAEVEKMLEDEAPFSEISATTGVSIYHLNKLFPGRAWTKEQVDDFATSVRRLRDDHHSPYHPR